jgi:hypothetical protein
LTSEHKPDTIEAGSCSDAPPQLLTT